MSAGPRPGIFFIHVSPSPPLEGEKKLSPPSMRLITHVKGHEAMILRDASQKKAPLYHQHLLNGELAVAHLTSQISAGHLSVFLMRCIMRWGWGGEEGAGVVCQGN